MLWFVFQDAFDHEAAKKAGAIHPVKGRYNHMKQRPRAQYYNLNVIRYRFMDACIHDQTHEDAEYFAKEIDMTQILDLLAL